MVIKTTGDHVLDRPLKEIGGKGLFTREIEGHDRRRYRYRRAFDEGHADALARGWSMSYYLPSARTCAMPLSARFSTSYTSFPKGLWSGLQACGGGAQLALRRRTCIWSSFAETSRRA